MKNIVIGRYIPGKGILYRLDPRTKIIAMLILMVATFVINEIIYMIGAIVLIALALLISKISIKRVYLGLRPLVFLLVFTFTFQIIFNQQGTLIQSWPIYYSPLTISLAILLIILWIYTKKFIPFKLLYFILLILGLGFVFSTFDTLFVFAQGSLSVYSEGLNMSLFIMMRLIIVVTLSTMLTITTKPTDLNLGLEYVLTPLKIIRVNAEEIAMIISISLRYIPTLLDEANKIMMAQASRGVDFQEGKFKDKIMQIVSLLVPMFIISFKRSDELANAMEARSFVPGEPRSRLHVLTWKNIDIFVLALSLALLTLSILLRVVF